MFIELSYSSIFVVSSCSAIGLSYGPNGNTSYDPGCVNDTIRLSTGEKTDSTGRHDV